MMIYLIRHGETEWNREYRYQGTHDIPLSREGMEKLRPAPFQPETVYVTKLRRTQQTAAILFPEARQVIVPGLEEMCFGAFEGRNYIEMAEDPDYRAWVDGGCLGPCPGGESREKFGQRVAEAFVPLMETALDRGEESLVIVAHGGTQMSLLERFGRPSRSYWEWLTGNGAGYVLSPDRWREDHVLEVLGEISCSK